VLDEVRETQRHFPASWVCLTGGEPLLQDISWLVRDLKKDGFMIQIETNGTIDRLLAVDWYTVSPKPPDYAFKKRFAKAAREVKLVTSHDLDIEVVRKVRKGFPKTTPIILQPESNGRASMKRAMSLLEQGLREGLPNVRVSCQLHKVFGIR